MGTTYLVVPLWTSRSRERICLLPTRLQEAEEKTCRLCLEGEEDGPLVQPCACRGSAKLIHKACLEKWRRTSKNKEAAYRCGQCKDHYRDALSLELLSARLQAKRTDGQSTRDTLKQLAAELQAQGKYDEAEPLFREVLELTRETFGGRHPNTLNCINNLGVLLQAKGDKAAAEPLLDISLELSRKILGSQHPSTLRSIHNLGLLLKVKGDLAAAQPLYREALEVKHETLGNRHPNTLATFRNLGLLLQAKGNLQAAETLYREALWLRREILGSGHPSTLRSKKIFDRLLKATRATPPPGPAAEPLLCERNRRRATREGPKSNLL